MKLSKLELAAAVAAIAMAAVAVGQARAQQKQDDSHMTEPEKKYQVGGSPLATQEMHQDINPAAPTHALIIPHKHIETLVDIGQDDHAMVGRVYAVAARIAAEQGFADAGYRVVANCNRDGGQTVFHIHFHLLAGRPLGWPPG